MKLKEISPASFARQNFRMLDQLANTTTSIELQHGIKQGCPLSPLLFNIVMEGVIRHLATFTGYRFPGGSKVCCLAYADDLCLASSTTDEMQRMITEVEAFFRWAGLALNATKCAALTLVNSRGRRSVNDFSLQLEGGSIPALQ